MRVMVCKLSLQTLSARECKNCRNKDKKREGERVEKRKEYER